MSKPALQVVSDLVATMLPSGRGQQQQQQLMVAVIVAAASVPLLYKVLFSKRRKLQYPPGPRGLPIIGNLFQLPDIANGELLDDKLLEWSKEYGLVYSIKLLGLGTWIVVSDPDLVKKIYVRENFEKSQMYNQLSAIVGSESLVSTPKKNWMPKRKAFNPGFAPTFLKDMVSTMAEKLERFVNCIDKDIEANQATNMLNRTQTFTSDVIVTIAFGEDWGGDVDTEHPARLWMSAIARELEGILMSPLKQMFGFAEKRQVRKYEDLIDGEMMRILERRLGDDSLHDKKDICSLAIEEMKRDGGELTQEDKVSITHQLKTFYFAGHDTTATTISWAVWLLSQHPEALDKVRAELKGHCVWTTPDRAPSYEDLQKCVYLEATLKETLRLYPPAAGVSRFTADAGAEWNGYSLTGALLMLSIYCMGRHPLLWKEPEIFRPDRFLDGSEEPPQSKYSINAKFTAFSKGPRDCMGKYFALLEAKLAVAALVSRYDLECVDPKERLISLLTTLPKNGAMIKFHHRKAES